MKGTRDRFEWDLKYDMYRNNWPLMALAHYATVIGALKRE